MTPAKSTQALTLVAPARADSAGGAAREVRTCCEPHKLICVTISQGKEKKKKQPLSPFLSAHREEKMSLGGGVHLHLG